MRVNWLEFRPTAGDAYDLGQQRRSIRSSIRLTPATRATIIARAVPVMSRKRFAPGLSGNFPALLCVVLLCLAVSACGDSCISGVFNPPNSMVQVKTCSGSLSISNGSIRMSFRRSPAPVAQGGSFAFRHIFVAVSGIEVFSAGSRDWREIAPALEATPAQIDLLASAPAVDCARTLLAQASIPPGDYSQVRLRLAPESAGVNFGSAGNQCRDVGVNCAVASDGAIRSLTSDLNGDPSAPQVLIGPGQIAGGSFRVLPDASMDLEIAFNAFSSRAVSVGDSLHLAPVFSAEPAIGCLGAAQASVEP